MNFSKGDCTGQERGSPSVESPSCPGLHYSLSALRDQRSDRTWMKLAPGLSRPVHQNDYLRGVSSQQTVHQKAQSRKPKYLVPELAGCSKPRISKQSSVFHPRSPPWSLYEPSSYPQPPALAVLVSTIRHIPGRVRDVPVLNLPQRSIGGERRQNRWSPPLQQAESIPVVVQHGRLRIDPMTKCRLR